MDLAVLALGTRNVAHCHLVAAFGLSQAARLLLAAAPYPQVTLQCHPASTFLSFEMYSYNY